MVRLKLTGNRIIFILLLLIAISSIFFYIFYVPKPITAWNFHNIILNFRANLREASKIPVYPNEDTVNTQLMNPLVQNVTIAFKSATPEENAYYAIEAFEITTKLYYGFRTLDYNIPNFTTANVSSYENLPGKVQNPIIALVAPSYSNETVVVVDPGHIIFIKAKSLQEFDLATIKFLMSVLQIKV